MPNDLDIPPRGPQPQAPDFAEAQAAGLEMAIDALATKLDDLGRIHKALLPNLDSWEGRGVKGFLDDLDQDLARARSLATSLRNDADAVAAQRRLYQSALGTYLTDVAAWNALPQGGN